MHKTYKYLLQHSIIIIENSEQEGYSSPDVTHLTKHDLFPLSSKILSKIFEHTFMRITLSHKQTGLKKRGSLV